MSSRLALLEFIRYSPKEDFRTLVENIARDLQLFLEAVDVRNLDPNKLDVYAPVSVRLQLKDAAKKTKDDLEAIIDSLRAAGTIKPELLSISTVNAIQDKVRYLEQISYILSQFKSEIGSETLVSIKAILEIAHSILPNTDIQQDKNFNRARRSDDKHFVPTFGLEQAVIADPHKPISDPSAEDAVLARANYLRWLGI